MNVAAVLLAAGRSSRFGAADKLAAPLHGLPLGLHAARALVPLPLVARYVVTGPTTLDWPGFDILPNDRPEAGMAHSIALADMPFVPTDHLRHLLARYQGPGTLVASSDGNRPLPPALFGADWFAALEGLTGDRGARELLTRAERVEAAQEELIDIDTEEQLRALHRRSGD